ncbi:MAG: hypothetical protein EKK63_17655 [Acinetobacter sp.]|uniref:hypothetical protein n=1 Tax=Acinetobacter sp. TaxID=472 RepID=UPI000FB478A5|nr:hypothetical protein [Acinetobacter sp.]RUP36345.1 MAG: hypothetical protein EKK63_17655 [Acinetobacter sp.]
MISEVNRVFVDKFNSLAPQASVELSRIFECSDYTYESLMDKIREVAPVCNTEEELSETINDIIGLMVFHRTWSGRWVNKLIILTHLAVTVNCISNQEIFSKTVCDWIATYTLQTMPLGCWLMKLARADGNNFITRDDIELNRSLYEYTIYEHADSEGIVKSSAAFDRIPGIVSYRVISNMVGYLSINKIKAKQLGFSENIVIPAYKGRSLPSANASDSDKLSYNALYGADSNADMLLSRMEFERVVEVLNKLTTV